MSYALSAELTESSSCCPFVLAQIHGSIRISLNFSLNLGTLQYKIIAVNEIGKPASCRIAFINIADIEVRIPSGEVFVPKIASPAALKSVLATSTTALGTIVNMIMVAVIPKT